MATVNRQIGQIAKAVARLEKKVSNQATKSQLAFSSVEDGSIDVNDADRVHRMSLGRQWDGTYTTVSRNGPASPATSDPTVEGNPGYLKVKWDGTFANADGERDETIPTPEDWSRVEVHAGTPGFTPQTGPNSETRLGTIETPGGASAVTALPAGDYGVVLLSVTESGVYSSPSGEVPGTVGEIVSSEEIDQLNQELDQAQQDLAQAQQDLADAQTTITGVQTDLDSAEHDLYDEGGRVDTIRDTLTGAVNTAQSTADAAASAADDAYSRAGDAMTAAQAAQATADGAIRTYYAATPPWPDGSTQPDDVLGDMWFNNTTGQAFRWNGTSWQLIEDNQIAEALAAAQAAQSTADGKITAYYQGEQPATGEVGDLWYDTDDQNKPYYCTKAAPNPTWTPIRDELIEQNYRAQNSKGTDLVVNGTGYMGDNTNFSQFTVSNLSPIGCRVSFRPNSGNAQNDELIPIDPSKTYILSVKVRELGSVTDGRFYFGYAMYDAFGNSITPFMYAYEEGTDTTLAADLNIGDTTVQITDPTGWHDQHPWGVIPWNYTDESGKVWEPHTYSRWAQLFDDVPASGNTFTLKNPWDGPALSAGHPVSNCRSGGNYVYAAAANEVAQPDWTLYTSNPITGVAGNTPLGPGNPRFPPGCSNIKILVLGNRNNAAANQAFASISFSDTTAAQMAADLAQATASGKNTVFWGTGSPQGDGNTPGDIWYRYQITGGTTSILAMWTWDGTTWQPRELDETFLPQVNIGTGTYGELDGARLKANSVIANQVVVQSSIGTTLIDGGAITAEKIAANAITAGKIDALAITTGTIAALAVTADKIAANAITADKIVGLSITGDKIAANAITADKISSNTITSNEIDAVSIAAAVGEFVKVKAENILAGSITTELNITAGGSISSGDENGAHSVLDPSGLTFYVPGGQLEGVPLPPRVATKLGGQDQAITLYSSINGSPSAQINSEGDATFRSVASENDITIAGLPLLGKLADPTGPNGVADVLSRGAAATADFSSVVQGTTVNAPAGSHDPTPMGQFTCTLYPHRVYRIQMQWRGYVSANSGQNMDHLTVRFYERHATNAVDEPADPTVNDNAIGAQTARVPDAGTGIAETFNAPLITGDPSGAGLPVQYKILLALWTNYGSFSPDVDPARPGMWVATLTDEGQAPWPAQVTLPGAASVQTYTSKWGATDSSSWDQNGDRPSNQASPNDTLLVGNGNSVWHSAFVANGTAFDGETTKTIPQALTGAVLRRARVYLISTWWEQDDGGQLQLQAYNSTTIPTSNTAPTIGTDSVKVSYTGQTQAKWIDIPTSWISGSSTGVMLGPPDWLGPSTHGHFRVAGVVPIIELTYDR